MTSAEGYWLWFISQRTTVAASRGENHALGEGNSLNSRSGSQIEYSLRFLAYGGEVKPAP